MGCRIHLTGCLKTLALLAVMEFANAIMASVPRGLDSCADFSSQPGGGIRHETSSLSLAHTWPLNRYEIKNIC